jgi:hypothetical protein
VFFRINIPPRQERQEKKGKNNEKRVWAYEECNKRVYNTRDRKPAGGKEGVKILYKKDRHFNREKKTTGGICINLFLSHATPQ